MAATIIRPRQVGQAGERISMMIPRLWMVGWLDRGIADLVPLILFEHDTPVRLCVLMGLCRERDHFPN